MPSKEDRKGKSAEAGARLTCHTHAGVVGAEPLVEVAQGMLGAGVILQESRRVMAASSGWSGRSRVLNELSLDREMPFYS